MLHEATDEDLQSEFNKMVELRSSSARSKEESLKEYGSFIDFEIKDHDFQTIKVQFRALGLITKSQRARSVKETNPYWTLTPYGDQTLTILRAIPKDEEEEEETDEDNE